MLYVHGSTASADVSPAAQQTQQSMAAQNSFLDSLASQAGDLIPFNSLQALWKQVQVWATSASSMTWPHWKRRLALQQRLAHGCPTLSVQVSSCDVQCGLFSELLRE